MFKHINYVVFVGVVAEVCFVPVYRSVDNSVPPVLGTPCSLEDCHSPPQPNVDCSLSKSPVKPLLVGRAFAGPMSPAKVHFCKCVCVCTHECIYSTHVCRA